MSVEPVEWKNYPSTETPLDAGTLNQQQAYVKAQADAAAQSATTAQQAAADAQAPTDQMVATVLATTGTAASVAALGRSLVGVDSTDYLNPASAASQHLELQAALNAAAAHPSRTLTIRPGTYVIDSPVTVPTGVTVQGQGAATLEVTGDTGIFDAESGTTFRGLTFVGTNPVGAAATLSAQTAISAIGTGAARLSDITVEECRFEGIEYAAVRIRHTDRFRVSKNTFLDTGYSAVQIGCAADGQVHGNMFRGTGVLPTYAVNSYAVSISLDSGETVDPDVNPQPTRIAVTGNVVTNQAWEGLDTHGGTDITFADNIITACELAIAVTVKVGTDGTAPQRIIVADNIINGEGYDPLRMRGGITVNGEHPPSTSRATVTITGNHVSNVGASVNHPSWTNPVRSGGIMAHACDTVIASNNTLSTILGNGLSFNACSTIVASGNIFDGMWRETGDDDRTSAAIYLSNHDGSLSATGNAMRTGQALDNANEHAIRLVSGAGQVHDSANDWSGVAHEGVTEYDTGWVDLTLINGWTVASGMTAQVRRVGHQVRIRGRVSGGSGAIATLDPQFRPDAQHQSAIRDGSGNSLGIIIVSTAGAITAGTATQPNIDTGWFTA